LCKPESRCGRRLKEAEEACRTVQDRVFRLVCVANLKALVRLGLVDAEAEACHAILLA
jgi:hypothetical protein